MLVLRKNYADQWRPPICICWAEGEEIHPGGKRMTVLLPSAADWLNSSCFCITLNRATLHAAMERAAGDPEFSSRYIHPRNISFPMCPFSWRRVTWKE